jgi:tetratricopeptide (TPR) repeat protein
MLRRITFHRKNSFPSANLRIRALNGLFTLSLHLILVFALHSSTAAQRQSQGNQNQASLKDIQAQAAHEAFNKGIELRYQTTAESLQQAELKFQEAAGLFRLLNLRLFETITLLQWAEVADLLGQKQKALEIYTRALPLSKAIGMTNLEVAILGNIGTLYLSLGEIQKALGIYQQVLPLTKELIFRDSEAGAYNNLGRIYLNQIA